MQRTPLYDRHRALGARFVEFGGWEMPVQYSGILAEHRAVREGVGLFDVSHMGEIEIRGAGAVAAAQELTVNDLGRLRDGEAQYSLLCRPNGGVVDDIMVHRVSDRCVFICVNASNRDKDFQWMRENCRGDAEVIDRSAEYALLALQGPRATAVLGRLTTLPLASIPRFAFRDAEVAGQTARVAHTGYTGEDGWEIYCANAVAGGLWDALLDSGSSDGIAPVGLGARDTLRLEAALPLYGHELDDDTTPLEAGLSWVVRFQKPEFLGREALLRQREAGVARRLIGMVLTEPGIPRQGYSIVMDGQIVGAITSGTKSPTLGKAIGLGYVRPAWTDVGTKLSIDIRGREVSGEVVHLPFYKRQVQGG
ncbi:MAG: glycine cleavage system aminomethyltransferase GcvT [Deltaproteobacteria bacterium]|nr:glycine cleavage system aminomethyltransferase GcvT [Deltaproteobacteria bacterium]